MKRRIAIAVLVFTALSGVAAAQTIDQTVATIRADYPERPTLSQVGELMNRTVYEHRVRYRLLLKDGGVRCPSPVGFISCDIVVDVVNGHHYDILADADGLAVPIPMVDKGLCVISPTSGCSMDKAVPAVLVGGPPSNPAPVPPPAVDLTPILTRLDEHTRLLNLILRQGGIGREEYDNLIRIVTSNREVEIRGNWVVGTLRGVVFGVK